MDKQTISEGKSAAITSYILIVGVLIALSMNSEEKNKFASFHIRQGLGLTLTFIILGVSISSFESIYVAAPMWIFISILTIYGIFILRKKEPNAERPYKAFGYPFIPALYIVITALICFALLVNDTVNTGLGLVIVALGIPVYYLFMKKE